MNDNWEKIFTNFFLNSSSFNISINVAIESKNLQDLPENLRQKVTLKLFSEYYDPNYLKNLELNKLRETIPKTFEFKKFNYKPFRESFKL